MTGLSDSHVEYIEAERKLSVETAIKYGLHTQGPKIAVPYIVKGRTLYAKLMDPRDKANTRCNPTGIEQTHLWNEDCLLEEPNDRDVLIITEGEWDALAMLQAGFQFVVSVPSGAAMKAEGCKSKAEKCLTIDAEIDGKPAKVLKPAIEKFKRVAVFMDGDHDGVLMRHAVVEIVGEGFCVLPEYPDQTKDANDVLKKHGIDALQSLVSNAVPAKDDGYVDFVTAAHTERRVDIYEIGIPFLSKHIKLTRPEFLVIGGLGGVGKTTLYQSIVYSLCANNPELKATILHLEGSRKIPYNRARAFWSRWFDRPLGPQNLENENACKAWIASHLSYIKPPQDELPTFEWLMWAMERQALQRGCNVFVIDPWNEIVHNREKGQNLTEYTQEAIIRMKKLADRLGLILIVCHHCRIPREDRPPNMYDLSDSQHWGHKADHVMLAWRPWVDRFQTRIELAKSKDYDTMGVPGHVWVQLKSQGFELEAIGDPIAAEKERKAAEKAQGKVIADAVKAVVEKRQVGPDPEDMIADQPEASKPRIANGTLVDF